MTQLRFTKGGSRVQECQIWHPNWAKLAPNAKFDMSGYKSVQCTDSDSSINQQAVCLFTPGVSDLATNCAKLTQKGQIELKVSKHN